jgi:zinc protease
MKRQRKRWLVAAICVGAAVTLAPAAVPGQGNRKAKKKKASKPAGKAKLAALPTIKTWSLPNGLQVAYMGVKRAPVVTVQVWYHVGSKEEARNRRGSAHMFEHMMFKGTKHVRPEEHARHLNRLGGTVNAFTTEDTTAYHNTLPKEYLDFAVKLEAERMRNLLFRKKMVDTEREVVKEEIRQQENNPLLKGVLRFLEMAYTKHPYAWTAGGAIKDLDATSVADLEKFYDTYYVPNNALLIVVGDVTEAQVKAAADKYFASIPKGKTPPRPADQATEPPQTKKRHAVVEPGQIGLVIAGYHIPAAKHPDIYPLQVLSLILGAGDSSRLNQRLVRKDKIAVQAGGQMLVREHPGMFALVGAFLKPEAAKKVEKALSDEVSKIQKTGPTARELRKAKNQVMSSFVFGLEGVRGLANQIGTSWILSGDATRFLRDLDKYEAVTAAEVKRVANTYLKETNATVVVIPPAGGAR